MCLTSALGSQRHTGLCEIRTSLDYTVRFRPTRTTLRGESLKKVKVFDGFLNFPQDTPRPPPPSIRVLS